MRRPGLNLFIAGIIIAALCSPATAETLSLPEGLRLAVDNSRLVRIAEREADLAGDSALVSRSRMLPSLNASAGWTGLIDQPGAIFGTNSVYTSQKDFFSFNINIQQIIYDFRASSSRYKAAMSLVELKGLDIRRVKNLAAIDFALAYFDLLESEKMVALAGQEISGLEGHLKDARALYEQGVITKNDLLQAEVRLADARQRQVAAHNGRDINAARLNSLLSRPLNTEIRTVEITDTEANPTLIDADIEKIWALAEKDRPEIRMIDATLRSLDHDETAARADYYPKFIVRGSYDYTENRYQLHEDNFGLFLGLTMNLFNGGATAAEVRKVDHLKARTIEQRSRLLDEIRLEVEKYILLARSARERLAVAKGAVGQAEENVRINKLRYNEGLGTATEALEAVTLLSASETNYYRALYDLGKAKAAVLYAKGQDLLEVYR